MAENKFLVSVADVKLYDNVTDDLLAYGKTLIDSSITQSIQSSVIYGGKQSQRLYEYNYQKELAIAISDAAFNVAFLSIQSNSPLANAFADHYVDEMVDFTGGIATITGGVVGGTVHVPLPNGQFTKVRVTGGTTVDNITTGGTIEVPSMGDEKAVSVSYTKSTQMDTMIISGTQFPKVVKMVLNADVMTNNGKVEELQIVIPNFKPDGALELSLTHDGVATTPLAGSSSVDRMGNHAYLSFIPIAGATAENQYVELAASPQILTMAEGETRTMTIYGVRGGIYGAALVAPSEVTFVSEDEGVATVADGVVTGVAAGTTYIKLNVGLAEDLVRVIVTA